MVVLMRFHLAKRRLIMAIEAGRDGKVEVLRLEALLRRNRDETRAYMDTLSGTI